jgi:hypothetical protein
MPDVGRYKTEQAWMSACVPSMIDEGRKQDQAVAACLSMWRRRTKDRSLYEMIKERIEEEDGLDDTGG